MVENIDFKVFSSDKEKMKEIKNLQKKTYALQLQSILKYYSTIPVEELANIIINSYEFLHKEKKVTVTAKTVYFEGLEDHLRKVYNALLTKIPRLEYKEMILLIVHHNLNQKL